MPALLSWLIPFLLAAAANTQPLFDGLAYTPSSSSTQNICLGTADVDRDLNIVALYTKVIRIYAISNCPAAITQIMEFAKSNNMTVFLGVWVDALDVGQSRNDLEIAALKTVLANYGFSNVISAVSVGNEVFSTEKLNSSAAHNGTGVDYLKSLITQVRVLLQDYPPIPLTTVETADNWDTQIPGSPARDLLSQVDFLGVNIHPYFQGYPVTCDGLGLGTNCYFNASAWAIGRAVGLQKNAGGKKVVVTESGWPTAGEACCDITPVSFPASSPPYMAVPSIVNSSKYLESFTWGMKNISMDYFYFETFDADWKKVWAACSCFPTLNCTTPGPCTYDYNWGILTSDRVIKEGLLNPPSPPAEDKPSLGSTALMWTVWLGLLLVLSLTG